MIEVLFIVFLAGAIWTALISILSFQATKHFLTGFLLSTLIATSPLLVILAIRGVFVVELDLIGVFVLLMSPIVLIVGALVRVNRSVERKMDPSRCSTCDYDLTDNVSGVCPECGTAIESNP